MLPSGVSIEALERLLRVWRRRLLAAAIAVVCLIPIIVHAFAAVRLALEPHLGLIGARLAMMGLFALIILAAVGFVVVAERRDAAREAEKAASEKSAFGAQSQVAAIVEALYVGYGLARGLRAGKAAEAAEAQTMAADPVPPEGMRPH